MRLFTFYKPHIVRCADGSRQFGAVVDGPLRLCQHDAFIRDEAGQQEFGAKRTNLLVREIDHTHDLAANQVFFRIQLRHLSRSRVLSTEVLRFVNSARIQRQ